MDGGAPSEKGLELELLRFPSGTRELDTVVVEEPLEIRVEDRPLAVTMRTPGHDEELAAGFLYSEGCIDGADDIAAMSKLGSAQDPDNTLGIRLASGTSLEDGRFASAQREFYASSSCGICGKATIEHILVGAPPLESPLRAAPELLCSLPDKMRAAQATFESTGGLHAAALFTPGGELEVLREDVGRHNAVDKVLGWRLLRDEVPVDNRILLVSGRAGFELVQKALVARIGVMAAVGAPSSLAVDLAREGGMQLVGFLRDGRFNQYAPAP
jgi:FdhD protein